MPSVGLWHISNSGPQKLASTSIDLESQLEDWIEQDPGLLEAGLTIVGRQVQVDGGPLDLLAVDSQGRWVVIELKRGTLYRETLAQALDYAASIAVMPHDQLMMKVHSYFQRRPNPSGVSLNYLLEESATDQDQVQPQRDVRISLVGTDSGPGLTRLTTYLASTYNLSITIITFHVYDVGTGQRVLVRELTETEGQLPNQEEKPRTAVEDVCRRADSEGIGEPFRRVLQAATRHGLYPRPYKTSVMYAPPSNRTRALFTVWTRPQQPGSLRMWIGPQAFAEFYPVSQSDATRFLGGEGWRTLEADQVEIFIRGLDELFASI